MMKNTSERKFLLLANILVWPAVFFLGFKKNMIRDQKEISCQIETSEVKNLKAPDKVQFKNCK